MLKNEHVCTAVEKMYVIVIVIVEYVAHIHFLTITMFDFLGKIIVESRIKNGSVRCYTNISIHTSDTTQIHISQSQSR